MLRHCGRLSIAIAASAWVLLANSSGATPCESTPLDCAAILIQHHELDAAIQSLNDLLRQSPRDLKALNLLGIALTESGRVQDANVLFRDALKINPRFYPAQKNLGINEFTQNRRQEAARDFEQVLKEAPDDEIAHLYLGEFHFEQKEWGVAAEHYQQGRSRISQNGSWILHYAECFLHRSGAQTDVDDVLKLLPQDDAEDRFKAGLLLGTAGSYTAAADYFASARTGYSDSYTAGYNQVLMLIRANDYTQAIRVSNELFERGFKRAELYNLVSEAFRKTGHIQEAYNSLRTAIQIEPRNEDNYADLAGLCLDYEDYALGQEILDTGIHYISNSYRLYVLHGIVLVMRGQLDQAETEFYAANKLAPAKSLPYVALSEVWMQKGEPQKAVDLLHSRLTSGASGYLIPYVFAVAVMRSGNGPQSPLMGDAVAALEKSIHSNPTFPHSHAELGKMLLLRGETDRAITELEAAMKLDAADASPAYQLLQAYRKKGYSEKAREMLAHVAELHSTEREVDLRKELKRFVRTETSASVEPAR